ncbi:anaerobic dimethyl sulfoxide reductase subunit C [Actinobacillus lignieresii]|uniref:DmsC/YnfH family molybdoenzyme membrane anchor subunit n=1 Tax=Actinobacillus lignieresii TaxID=720 RepID=UPI000E19FE0E|nr:DmsC/YnfH family molybdoenzyme membrane anchor subunit [Actinobacillus lignieresii]SUU00147.1 anaerobic dimethyl sulfoxide reductase subunit C [Actinobacillus lignieresii]VEB27256.1 anaerobic dimethyl sulfoxide reductase subunit C [Actinobacillus lignieresii]
MNAGLHELPLVFFTVLAQTAVGFWLIFTFVMCKGSSPKSQSYLHKGLFVALLLLACGFIASVTHLGSPLRAFNSLNRVGSSMMSNEIASGAVFFALAGGYWLLAVLGKMPQGLSKVWLVVTALVGVVFMYMMNNLYHLPTVPTWNNAITSWQFYLTVVLGGCALAMAVLSINPHQDYQVKCSPWLYVLAVFCVAVVVIYQAFGLAHIHSSVQQAVNLVPDFAIMQVLRLCLLAVAAALIVKGRTLPLLSLAVLITLAAEMIGRVLFYGLHMTSGMAV